MFKCWSSLEPTQINREARYTHAVLRNTFRTGKGAPSFVPVLSERTQHDPSVITARYFRESL